MSCTHSENHELPEDDQELRLKHVRAIIINKNTVKQVGIKYYIYNIVAQKMCNIKFMVCCVGSSNSGKS
jgi:nitrous oxidase accessory protein NosD